MRALTCEGDGGLIDVEVGGIEDKEAGGGGDCDGDPDGSGELAGDEVGLEEDIVAGGRGELGEARLAFELLDALIVRHCY